QFHVQPGVGSVMTPINLAGAVNPNSQGVLRTTLDDDQGPLTLHPAPMDAGVDAWIVIPPGGGAMPPALEVGAANLLEQVFQNLGQERESMTDSVTLPARNERAGSQWTTLDACLARTAPGGATAFGDSLLVGRKTPQ